MKKLTRPLFAALGLIALAGAAVGAVLPVLPTTPLLLLSVFCFARSSERFYRWLLETKLYRDYLEEFVREKTLPLKTKLVICLPVTVMLLILFRLTPVWPARLLLLAALIFKWYYFFFRLKTAPSGGIKAVTATKGDGP
ncbi:MAG: YbaN family protein [Gracilibacteraceae bacterium]|jgi:uncharacterized membrane protein YbaN (DUF454 family)|nr:YbaN family protein [Gracilibacteraceae bacterium]